jgi:hypothetical protein
MEDGSFLLWALSFEPWALVFFFFLFSFFALYYLLSQN